MHSDLPSSEFDIAIIGGAAGGVLTALQLLRQATAETRIVMIEPAACLAQGVAYATHYAEHLLNVSAGRMSAFNDRPGDFVDFLVGEGDSETPGKISAVYAERRRYGAYLRARLEQARSTAAAHFEVRQDRVTGMQLQDGEWRLPLQSGPFLLARSVVLAVGNNAKPLPARNASSLPAGLISEAWDFDAIKRIPVEADVCIAGSGLSMVDAALSLAANGHRGQIHVLSRHALLPLPHAAGHALAPINAKSLEPLSLRARMQRLRQAADRAQMQGLPWQAVMEAVRPSVQALWSSLSLGDQQRFLRHVVRYWDVHRHRIAAGVHAQLVRLQADGQLQLHRGRMDAVAHDGMRIVVTLSTAETGSREIQVDRVINATGVEMRVAHMRNPVLSDLLQQGLARPGPHGIGIDTTAEGALVDAHGAAVPDVAVIGSLRIGRLWESIAVPELRGQAETAAKQLLFRTRQ